MDYNLSAVSPVAIVGMVFSLCVSIGVPIALCIAAKKRLHARLHPVFIGAAVFAVVVLVLESLAHRVILSSAVGAKITDKIWLYAVYGGVMAALFEEFGRLFAMKLCMKKCLARENAIMYGIGHGGFEAIVLVGLAYISNIATAIMINTGAINATLAALDSATAEATVKQLSALCATSPALFFAAGVERISAIALHICLSYFVYRAVRYGEGRYFALALLAHFAVDAVVVILNNYFNIFTVELVLMLSVAVLAWYAVRLYRGEASGTGKDCSVL